MRRLQLPMLIVCLILLSVAEALAQNQERISASRPRTVSRTAEATREAPTTPASRPVPKLSTGLTQEPPEAVPPAFVGDASAAELSSLELMFSFDVSQKLLTSIQHKLGVPYRYFGTDDSGYDCSGFVWRVFQEAGLDFTRNSARNYWLEFPAATEPETRRFGTLVFFNELGHVGIVRDASSFYHVSTSQGVTLSSLSGYWANRITGYRRIQLSSLPALLSEKHPAVEKTGQSEGGELPDTAEQKEPEVRQPEPAARTKGKKGKVQAEENEPLKR